MDKPANDTEIAQAAYYQWMQGPMDGDDCQQVAEIAVRLTREALAAPANDTAASVILPTIHSNGTARETLITEHMVAIRAIDAAVARLLEITVHMRDYYVHENGNRNFEAAVTKRLEQSRKLNSVRDDLEEILGALLEQGE
jgi:hypothetical protein